MIVDRYPAETLFALVPKRLADFEPELRELDRLLEDDALFQQVKADLSRRRPHSRTRGRHSTPVEVLLRMLVVKRLYQWSYDQTEHFVGDSLVLRQSCRVYWAAVPDDPTLLRWAQLIGPATLERLNARVVELARARKVTRGRKLPTVPPCRRGQRLHNETHLPNPFPRSHKSVTTDPTIAKIRHQFPEYLTKEDGF